MSLSRKLCVYLQLHRCLYHAVNMNFASDKASFCKIRTRYKLKTLPILSEVLFVNFVFFCSLLRAIVYPNFPISSFIIEILLF